MADTLKTAVSGLNDAVLRVANAVNNLVNARTTGRLPAEPGEKPTSFLPRDVVTLSSAAAGQGLGVTSSLREREPAYFPARDPSSPDANAEGLVAAPNVDIASELLTVLQARVTYRASAAVIKTTFDNDRKLLDTLS